MQITKEIIERLWYMRTWCCNFELFTKIYKRDGEDVNAKHSLASHMWRKFNSECKADFLVFWRVNDKDNQRAILKYLNSDEFEKRFKHDMASSTYTKCDVMR